MLRRLVLRDFAIVTELDVELHAGFTVLTGETGAGKSILIDALQLALGSRGDAGVVREGAGRADISAEFDVPASLTRWLTEGGFDADDGLLLRRSIDAAGKSKAWINGSPATVAQLRQAAAHLVDIHGQHAWQSLTHAPAVRALLDTHALADIAPVQAAWTRLRDARQALVDAQHRGADIDAERDRLAWQIGEVDKLAPGDDEWAALNAEHAKLSNAQSLLDAARTALDAVSDADDNAATLVGRAALALQAVAAFDPKLGEVLEVLRSAEAQLQDAGHTLNGYLNHTDLEPSRLQALDERLAAWLGLARRYRRPPAELPVLWSDWKAALLALDRASDADALTAAVQSAQLAYDAAADRLSAARRAAAPPLAWAVTAAMQQLGMSGGRFEIALSPQDTPQPYGRENVEFLVAGHAGSTPRPLAKVASGGELSRIALAISVVTAAVTTNAITNDTAHDAATDAAADSAGTLIFDEVDAGVGGTVGESVGRLMQQLGARRQVLAVTHLPQVAAYADHHLLVSKDTEQAKVHSAVHTVSGERRVAEIARMLGGERLADTGFAHARQLLLASAAPSDEPTDATPPAAAPDTTPQRRGG